MSEEQPNLPGFPKRSRTRVILVLVGYHALRVALGSVQVALGFAVGQWIWERFF
jgi:hypothetical protein